MDRNPNLAEAVSAIVERIRALQKEKAHVTVAIDGRCASGKSTLADTLAEEIGCHLFRMDDFFLPMEKKTEARLSRPSENVDHERFRTEVAEPLAQNVPFVYRPFECGRQSFGALVSVEPHEVSVIEGVYCCRPDLWEYADLHVFLDVDKNTQRQRILARNGAAMAKRFETEWIPLEETYFLAFSVKEHCEMIWELR